VEERRMKERLITSDFSCGTKGSSWKRVMRLMIIMSGKLIDFRNYNYLETNTSFLQIETNMSELLAE
jgi:hypothetical protein